MGTRLNDIRLRWDSICEKDDCKCGWSAVLYAYLAPGDNEIVYVGKADGARSTVRRRWDAKGQGGLAGRARAPAEHLSATLGSETSAWWSVGGSPESCSRILKAC